MIRLLADLMHLCDRRIWFDFESALEAARSRFDAETARASGREAPLRNPYPRQPGFPARVRYARNALRRFGADYEASPYSRRFDTCFEMFDGKAVVWALMHGAIAGDALLERGIRNMGPGAWRDWECVYRGTPCSGDAEATLPLAFNHAFDFAFSVETDEPSGVLVSGASLRQALLTRLASLSDAELREAVGMPFDTYAVTA